MTVKKVGLRFKRGVNELAEKPETVVGAGRGEVGEREALLSFFQSEKVLVGYPSALYVIILPSTYG
jgi:hypothetical protein